LELTMTITIQPIDASAGSPTYTAQQERQALSALLGGGSPRALGAVSGFRVGTAASVVSVTSTTWTVNPCSAVIDPAATTVQGAYRWSTDTTVTGSITAADATNPRKDILYIQVNDASAGDGSGARNANILYLAGVPAATPSAPALPPRSFLIAGIDVPKSGAGAPTATWNKLFTVAAGGILPVATQAIRDALTTYPGLAVWRLDLNVLQIYTGSAWRTMSYDDRPFAHMGKTNAFQALSGTTTKVTMDAAQTLIGGFTFDNASDAVVVPLTGWYQVRLKGFFTGASAGVNQTGVTVNGTNGPTGVMQGIISNINKMDGNDVFVISTGRLPFNAGDKVGLYQFSAVSCWGTNGYDGSYLELEYDGA
jgi:hypothetical protein